ncbi:hypothetical protein C9374_003530 [Naegleria lovaniensis]|uniref:Uncharacterized protein n=1 Tax=Naegleria lovaniensis TaxID=51637 RepID=A0AA88GN23_NAELO|nr:uncharacterized protein C9374_003530 [Naegleria lovaniensis]KAG2385715.1 hypothetical protein C9374_003530 [Naegleria lovaniensis]
MPSSSPVMDDDDSTVDMIDEEEDHHPSSVQSKAQHTSKNSSASSSHSETLARDVKELMKIAKGLLELKQKIPSGSNLTNQHVAKLYKYLDDNKLNKSLKELKLILSQYMAKSDFDSLFSFVQTYFLACRNLNDSEASYHLNGSSGGSSSSGSSFSSDIEKLARERTFILKCLVSWMFEGRIEGRVAKNGLFIIYEELDYIPDNMLISLIQVIYKLFKDGSCAFDEFSPVNGSHNFDNVVENSAGLVLDVWSQCISTVMSKDEIEINAKSKKKKKTDEYKTTVIKDICSCDWSQKVLAFANAFKDMPLTEVELDIVLDKLLCYLQKMNLNDSAPLIYQLLLLSSRGKKQKILQGIISYFDSIEKEKRRNSLGYNEDSILNLEGTVLHFIDYATKQNQDLASEMLKLIKNEPSSALNTFKVSFLLIISSLTNFEEKTFKLLKSLVEEDYRHSSKSRIFITEEEQTSLTISATSSKVIMDTVKKCGRGRDFMVKSVVDFACYLLDSKKPKTEDATAVTLSTQALHPHSLGLEILGKIFEINHVVRSDILSRIFNRVVTNYGNIEKYIELLTSLALNQTSCLLDHISKLKETIEYLSTMPTDIAKALLAAVQPLYKTSQEFQDQVVLVLRKSMYNRELDSRQVALSGFLQILLSYGELDDVSSHRNVGSSSSSSSSSSSNHSKPSSVDLEIIGFLRRCLSMQTPIRQALYRGLSRVVQKKPYVLKEICPVAIDQFKKYVSMNDDNEVDGFFLDSCIDSKTMTIIEPIPDLLMLIADCSSPEDGAIYDILLGFIQFFLHKGLSDFGIDSPFDDSHEGRKNRLIATLYVGCIESILYFAIVIMVNDKDNNNSIPDIIDQCWEKYSKVLENLTKKSASKKKTTEKFDYTEFLPELSSIFCKNILEEAARKTEKSKEKKDDHALTDSKFHMYIFKLITKKIKMAKKGQQPLEDKDMLDLCRSVYSFLIRMSNVVSKTSSESDSSKTKEAEKKEKVTALATESFEDLIKMKFQSSTQREAVKFLEGFISVGKNTPPMEDDDQRICHFMRFLQKIATNMIQQKSYVTATCFIRLLTTLAHLLRNKTMFLEKEGHYQWITDICKTKEFEDKELGRALINHLVLIACIFSDMTKIHEIASDVLGKVGHFENSGVSSVSNMLVINCPSESADVLISYFNVIVDDLDWKFQRLESIKKELDGYETMKHSIFHQAAVLIDSIEKLASATLPIEVSDKLFTPLIKYFTLIASFTDTYLNAPKDTELPEELVDLLDQCGRFTSSCYSFINYHNGEEEVSSMKALREARNIPELVFRMETSEKNLILLSKNLNVNLLTNYKRSQVRSFIIDQHKIDVAGEEKKKKKKSKKEADDDENDGDNQEDDMKPKKKKSKKKKAANNDSDVDMEEQNEDENEYREARKSSKKKNPATKRKSADSSTTSSKKSKAK